MVFPVEDWAGYTLHRSMCSVSRYYHNEQYLERPLSGLKKDLIPLSNHEIEADDTFNGPLCSLPPELFDYVQDRLNFCDRWCLAVTCRKMYRSVLFPGNYLMTGPETSEIRERFYRDRLEKFVNTTVSTTSADVAACKDCLVYHPASYFAPGQFEKPLEHRHCVLRGSIHICDCQTLTWSDAKNRFLRFSATEGFYNINNVRNLKYNMKQYSIVFTETNTCEEHISLLTKHLFRRQKNLWSKAEFCLEVEWALTAKWTLHRLSTATDKETITALGNARRPICPHVSTHDELVLSLVQLVDKEKLVEVMVRHPPHRTAHVSTSRASPISHPSQCEQCDTSFFIYMHPCGKFYVLRITRILGFMDVEHPSMNPKWVSQITYPDD